jgi:hypothetical protein
MFDLRNHVSEQVVSISVKFVVIGSKSGIFDDGRTEVGSFLQVGNLRG